LGRLWRTGGALRSAPAHLVLAAASAAAALDFFSHHLSAVNISSRANGAWANNTGHDRDAKPFLTATLARRHGERLLSAVLELD
jgi:hypothetical protein